MEQLQKIMNLPKIFKQVSNFKISNTVLVLILSYNFGFKEARSVLACLSKKSRELGYNSNMLNVICQKTEVLVYEKAIMDLGSGATASSYFDANWMTPRLDGANGFHNAVN